MPAPVAQPPKSCRDSSAWAERPLTETPPPMMALLQNAPLYVVPFLLVITVIVTIHELGHFLTARAFGVAVDRFSIGFGPTLFARRDKAGVEWRIGALPVGGYVRFAGAANAPSI